MPKEVFGKDYPFVPRDELLSFEEISRLVRILTGLGVRKVRLTGGEPLLRRGLAGLVQAVAAIPGVEDLALTTNGSLLAAHAEALRTAGLHRITVSLDSVDPDVFAKMSDSRVPLRSVLAGIDAAVRAGFAPVKLNAVVRRGLNDATLPSLVDYARFGGHVLRFIEYMDVGTTNGWRLDEVVPATELLARIDAIHPLEPLAPTVYGEVAKRYRFRDGTGEIGFVTSVSQPFCGSCTRARLTAVGELFTCLFGTRGADLRSPLRAGASDEELAARLTDIWRDRADRYSELRRAEQPPSTQRVEMSYVGG
jgi:cyclic pyranopterin phosphate synthase